MGITYIRNYLFKLQLRFLFTHMNENSAIELLKIISLFVLKDQ